MAANKLSGDRVSSILRTQTQTETAATYRAMYTKLLRLPAVDRAGKVLVAGSKTPLPISAALEATKIHMYGLTREYLLVVACPFETAERVRPGEGQ